MISDYEGLQEAVAGFLNRDDLADAIRTFISLGEAMIARDVRHWRMIEVAPVVISGRFTALPADWVETRRINIDMRSDPLELVALDVLQGYRAQAADAAGEPRYFAHVGGNIEVFPTPGDSYTGEWTYYGRVPALTDLVPTNWLLAEAPDVYLYSALVQSAPYLQEDERVQTWGAMFGGARDRLNESGNKATFSGAGLKMRAPRQG